MRAHARGKRRTIGALDLDIFVIFEKILHWGNYGAPGMQAILPATLERRQDRLRHAEYLRHDLEPGRYAS